MSSTDTREDTTIAVRRSLKSRMDSLKPYDSISYGEFIKELLDEYEGEA